jgi:hypothetical protein
MAIMLALQGIALFWAMPTLLEATVISVEKRRGILRLYRARYGISGAFLGIMFLLLWTLGK